MSPRGRVNDRFFREVNQVADDKDTKVESAPVVDQSPTLTEDVKHSKHRWGGFRVQGGEDIQMCVVCGKQKAAE